MPVEIVLATGWTDVASSVAAVVAAGAGLLALLGVRAAQRQIAVGEGQLDEAKRSRHALLISELAEKWNEPSLVEARKLESSFANHRAVAEAIETSFLGDHELYLTLERIPAFFENLALLEKYGALSLELVRDMFGPVIVDEYRRWEPSLSFLRTYDTQAFTKFRDLAERLA